MGNWLVMNSQCVTTTSYMLYKQTWRMYARNLLLVALTVFQSSLSTGKRKSRSEESNSPSKRSANRILRKRQRKLQETVLWASKAYVSKITLLVKIGKLQSPGKRLRIVIFFMFSCLWFFSFAGVLTFREEFLSASAKPKESCFQTHS